MTQQKTTGELSQRKEFNLLFDKYKEAKEWWEGLDNKQQTSYCLDTFNGKAHHTSLTIGQITQIWEKETTPISTDNKELEKRDIYNEEWEAVSNTVGIKNRGVCEIIATVIPTGNKDVTNSIASLMASAPDIYRENKVLKEALQSIANYDMEGLSLKSILINVQAIAMVTLHQVNAK